MLLMIIQWRVICWSRSEGFDDGNRVGLDVGVYGYCNHFVGDEEGLMSRSTVRNAVVKYFEPPTVPGLNKIYSAAPKRIEGPSFRFGQPPGTESGAVGVVHLVNEYEERIAIGGEHSGKKWVHYTVEIQVFLHSVHRLSEDAMTDFDAVIDGIKTALRADRRLNDWPVIFEAGEKALEGEYGEPRVQQDGSTEIWGAVRFEVSEILTT